MKLITVIEKMISPIRRKVQLMIVRAVVRVVNDDKMMQSLQLSSLKGQLSDGIERVQSYGFTSVPNEGAEAIILHVGGNSDHGVVIACDDRRYRLKGLKSGEVALYTDEGDKIHFKRKGKIEIKCSSEVTVNSPKVNLGGSAGSGVLTSKLLPACFVTGAKFKCSDVVLAE